MLVSLLYHEYAKPTIQMTNSRAAAATLPARSRQARYAQTPASQRAAAARWCGRIQYERAKRSSEDRPSSAVTRQTAGSRAQGGSGSSASTG